MRSTFFAGHPRALRLFAPPQQPRISRPRTLREGLPTLWAPSALFSAPVRRTAALLGERFLLLARRISSYPSTARQLPHPQSREQQGELLGGKSLRRETRLVCSCGTGMATPRRAAAVAAAALSRSSIGSGGSAGRGDEPQSAGRKVSRGTRGRRRAWVCRQRLPSPPRFIAGFGGCWRRIG